MKILFHVGVDPDSDEGHGVHVRRLTEALEGRGHQVWVVGTSLRDRANWQRPEPGLIRVPLSSVPKLGWVHAQVRGARILERLARTMAPDVLLARSDVLSFAPLLAKTGLPLAVESNASVAGHLRGRSGPRNAMARRVEKALLERARVVGCVTPALIERHRENYGLGSEKFGLVPNGAPVPPTLPPSDREKLRLREGVNPNDFLLAYAGTFSRHVEFDWIVQAVESVPQAKLWVMGEGPAAEGWKVRWEGSTAKDRIRFFGPLAEVEAARRLQCAQCIVAPYAADVLRAIAGDPMKVVFGMACGRYVLASGVTEDPPLDATGAGRVIPSGPDAWTQVVAELSSKWSDANHPQEIWPWSGDAPGPSWVREHRTWEHSARRWEELFSLALDRAPSG